MTGHSERIGLGVTTLADGESFARCEERFAALVNRQARFVFRVAYAVVRNSHDAEDVVQEVFLKLYRLRGWDKIEDERAYLARMAWRAAVDHLPKTKGDRLALDAESPSRDESPEQAAVLGNWAAVVHQLMDALPEELRQPLALSAVDDLKSFEIAGMLGIPEGTVRTRIKKAREILKQKLWRLTGESYGRRHG